MKINYYFILVAICALCTGSIANAYNVNDCLAVSGAFYQACSQNSTCDPACNSGWDKAQDKCAEVFIVGKEGNCETICEEGYSRCMQSKVVKKEKACKDSCSAAKAACTVKCQGVFEIKK